MRRILVAALLAIHGLFCLRAADAETIVFEDVRIIDVVAGAAGPPQSLAVRDGWIVDASAAEGDASARRIDAGGRFVIPGLAEMHAHVPGADDPQAVDDVLALFLAHGVTTIRGMLGEPAHLDLRAALAAGDRIGPRLITSGPSLNGRSVPDAAAAGRRVRRQAEAGYDFLKLHPGLRPDTFAAIVAAADGLDIDFAGHVSIAVGLDRALAARQATIDHLDSYAQALVPADHPARRREPGFFGMNLADTMDPERISDAARRTAEAGVWNVPTQTLIENIATADLDELAADPAMRWVPAVTVENWRARIESMRGEHSAESLRRFVDLRRRLIAALHEAGAGVLLGADAPQIFNVPGDSLHRELALYVAAGLSPAEALATGTVHVGRFLGQPAVGCLRPGCVADLVLLDADPLSDISHTRRIAGVMRGGQWFDRARLDALLAEAAERARATGPD